MEQGSEFGPYLIGDRLGSGGMGVVYRATDRRVPRTVALKILNPSLGADPQYRERFRRESAVLSAAEHPHIVPMYGTGEIDGRLYLDMRYIDGLDLQSWLAARGPIPPRRAAAMIDGLADALDFVHSRGILHRDIKPSNIVLAGARAFPYLLDFGIARSEDESGLTHVNTVVGSLEYMAPERFEGHPADRRTDIYALTGVLLAAVTGRPPYAGCAEMLRAVRAHCFDPVPRPSEIDPALAPLDEVIAHGMAKDPAARFGTAEHLAEAATHALERIGAARPAAPPAHPVTAPPLTPPPAPTMSPPVRTMTPRPAPTMSPPIRTMTPPPAPPLTPPPAPTMTPAGPGDGFGAPTFTTSQPLPAAVPGRPPGGPSVPAALRWLMTAGALTVAGTQMASAYLPIVSAGTFHVAYVPDAKHAVAVLAAPAMVAVAALLFALGQDRLFDFAAGLTIAGVMFAPAYLLDLTRRVHFAVEPAGSGYKLAIGALVLGLVVGVLALWSPGRRALRGRARWWPWITGVAVAGLAADLVLFHQADAYSGATGWQRDPWAAGYLALTAGTVVAALYIFGGRRIALGMLVALTVYSAAGDLVAVTDPGAQTLPTFVLVSDAVVIAAGFAGWFTMPRPGGVRPATGTGPTP